MKKIVVFASGSGSNFQTIVDKLHQKVCEVSLLVCDKPGAYCIERAEKLQIPTFVFNPKAYETKAEFETEICKQLAGIQPDLIVLAGYMRIIGETLLSVYEGKIINIHPALLPAFPGRDGIGDALNYGVKVMGVTVHYVDAGIDTGHIIDQLCFKRIGNESREEIEQQIHELEHELYPQVIAKLLQA
ncbi:MAG: phosphoribosylglycinamide formyltransferase [Turicibacter sp.]|nr:phosphoribosylglycinamide formyltransferase [Turicibacter sp.]